MSGVIPGYENVSLQWGVVIGASLAAAICDATCCRIPNWLTMPVWLAGLVWSGWAAGVAGLGDAVGGSLLMAAPYMILFVWAGGGAGDAKLMAALGAWLGIREGAVALVAVCAAGIVVGLIFAAVRGRALAAVSAAGVTLMAMWLRLRGVREALAVHVHDVPVARHDPHAFPYAVAILAGVLVAAGVRTWGG